MQSALDGGLGPGHWPMWPLEETSGAGGSPAPTAGRPAADCRQPQQAAGKCNELEGRCNELQGSAGLHTVDSPGGGRILLLQGQRHPAVWSHWSEQVTSLFLHLKGWLLQMK